MHTRIHLAATLLTAGVAAVAVFPVSAAAQTPAAHFPTNEDLRHTRALGDPQLSPDGRSVLFSLTEPTVGGASAHLWAADVGANTSRQLTFAPVGSKSSEHAGTWSPDGRAVYFIARRGKHAQLYRLMMNGGEAQPFTIKLVPSVDASTAADAVAGSTRKASPDSVEADVSSYAISPDGRTAAVVVRDPETLGEEKQKTERADASAVDQDLHGTRAYLLDLSSSTVTSVGVPSDVSEVAWSHRGDRLAVVTSPMNNAGDLAPADKVWIVDVASPASPKQLAQMPATTRRLLWSPSDTRFFFSAQAAADAPPGYSDLYVMTVGGGDVKNLSSGYSGSVNEPTVAESDDAVIAAVENGTRSGYARFSVGSSTPAPLAIDGGVVSELATNDHHTGWVYSSTDTDAPQALYVSSILGGSGGAVRIHAPLTAGDDWRAVKASVVQWKTEGRTIEGLLYLPPQASNGKVPLVVAVHGGPLGAWTGSYSPFAQFLVGHGWAVLMPNPRGSSGHGAAFAAANKNDLGGGDYRDIMTGVDAMIAGQPILATKLAVYGYSYGGEMAGFIEGKTDRFKAIVSCAPVIDQFSEYGTEDGSWYDRWYFGKPWERFEDAWRQSPLAGASHAKTPFMLLQGEGDTTDPLGQSLEMYRALRQAGVSVQLVTYPRDNHGPLSRNISGGPSPEPWHGFDARQRIVAFYEAEFGR